MHRAHSPLLFFCFSLLFPSSAITVPSTFSTCKRRNRRAALQCASNVCRVLLLLLPLSPCNVSPHGHTRTHTHTHTHSCTISPSPASDWRRGCCTSTFRRSAALPSLSSPLHGASVHFLEASPPSLVCDLCACSPPPCPTRPAFSPSLNPRFSVLPPLAQKQRSATTATSSAPCLTRKERSRWSSATSLSWRQPSPANSRCILLGRPLLVYCTHAHTRTRTHTHRADAQPKAARPPLHNNGASFISLFPFFILFS